MKQPEFTVFVDDNNIDWYGMKLIGYEIQSYLRRKNTGTDIPGAHGTQAVPSALASSEFKVRLACTGNNADDVNTKIREFFAFMYSTSEARKIVFSDDESIIRYAILDAPEPYKVVNGMDGAFAELVLTMLMLDPFMYDKDISISISDAVHGQKIVVNNPAFECPAIFQIENLNDETVKDVALIVNDELTKFSCELRKGDVLELDTVEYEVRLNGDVRLDYWEGEMPMLKHGDNVVYQQNLDKQNIRISVFFTKQWV